MENQDEQSEEIGDQKKVLRVKTYKDSKEKYEKNSGRNDSWIDKYGGND